MKLSVEVYIEIMGLFVWNQTPEDYDADFIKGMCIVINK